MRGSLGGLHFQMSDSQRHRLSKAQQLLREAPGSHHSSVFVNVADPIQVQNESTVLKGHGTQHVDGELLATLCGLVERVDQLVTVRPLRARYNANIGDVVVGRISEVGSKRWKVDINSKLDVHLMLSAVNLPGGIQRRRTVVDELNMRTLFVENDLISAEVQSVHSDGSVHLHTRSLKYGKLEKGQLVKVAPYLVKPMKQHFHSLKQYGVDIIIGCNGYVWVSALSDAQKPDELGSVQSTGSTIPGTAKHASLSSQEASAGTSGEHEIFPANEQAFISLEVRERICRFSNVIRVLSALGFLISPDSIIDTFEASLSWGIAIKDILGAEFCVKVAEEEAGRRVRKSGSR